MVKTIRAYRFDVMFLHWTCFNHSAASAWYFSHSSILSVVGGVPLYPYFSSAAFLLMLACSLLLGPRWQSKITIIHHPIAVRNPNINIHQGTSFTGQVSMVQSHQCCPGNRNIHLSQIWLIQLQGFCIRNWNSNFSIMSMQLGFIGSHISLDNHPSIMWFTSQPIAT